MTVCNMAGLVVARSFVIAMSQDLKMTVVDWLSAERIPMLAGSDELR